MTTKKIRRKKSSPIQLFILNLGYTQTLLRTKYGHFGEIVPLADILLPKILEAGVLAKTGVPISKRQQVVEALCAIRSRTAIKGHRRTPRVPTKRLATSQRLKVTSTTNKDQESLDGALDALMDAAGTIQDIVQKLESDLDNVRNELLRLSRM
jgi:hypothetical protein